MDDPPTTPCPHCGQPVRAEYTHCPFCGTDVATGDRTQGLGGGANEPNVTAEEVKTGAAMGCITSGSVFIIAAGYSAVARTVWVQRHWHGAYRPEPPLSLMWTQPVIPLVLLACWYLVVRRRAPAFARGLGYSVLISVPLLLGALAVCR